MSDLGDMITQGVADALTGVVIAVVVTIFGFGVAVGALALWWLI